MSIVVSQQPSTRIDIDLEAQVRKPATNAAAPSRIVANNNLDINNKIIDHVSDSITSGFWAIMGASGSGKTNLLRALYLRLHAKYMNIEREFPPNRKQLAYVMQDDVLHAEFTAEETLLYAARLRMPGELTFEDRKQRVVEVMELMGIIHCLCLSYYCYYCCYYCS